MKQWKFLAYVYYKNGVTELIPWLETTKDAKEKAKNYKNKDEVREVKLYRIDKTFKFQI